ncbi:XkdX family protein [Bacillus paralicheniformis]|uniref:XkdX family protein n=1 Tax=Bacillus paralicheniformis TaxID=1648923 RepID=UPI001C241315|nr:XkdX family protein [Bacillus paralicheniformis]MBU8759257.1 XkdX family protein [Bacillus paralicheniformis]
MANIKDVKAPLDREFRNTINENFRAMNGDVSASKAQMDEALSEAKAANKTAGDALTTAGEAERVANNVQEQFNGVVLEGSIDPETAQARVDYNGKEYETLKARIDANQVEVMSTQSSVQSLSLNALDFKEDGDTDAAAINKAIEYAAENGLGNVHISKDVTLDAPIYAKSNIRITSDPAAKIEVSGGNGIVIEGSIGEEIPIAANLTMGDTVIETTVAHGLKVGDLVRIKSQRDALSSDAGDNWRLGYATASVPGCYFGEFVRVKTVTSTTSFETTAGLLFPDYRTDSANETASTARATTTIQKVTPIENVIIDGLNFTGKASRFITFKYANHCYTRDNTAYSVADGYFIIFENSLACGDSGSRIYYDTTTAPTEIYTRNAFKVVSSQACGFFGSYAENGSQPFDITYTTGETPSISCYVNHCGTKGSTQNPMTSHGGTYKVSVIGNNFTECQFNGISVRTRSSVISANTVTGASNPSSYGIGLYEGWARDCTVTSNTASGFRDGIRVIDGPTAEQQFKWVGAVLANNSITNTNQAFYISRDPSNQYTGEVGIEIFGNVVNNMSGSTAKPVRIEAYVCGVEIHNNVFNGSGASNYGVYAHPNTNRIAIVRNKFVNIGRGIRLDAPTDSTIGTPECEIVENKYIDGTLSADQIDGWKTKNKEILGFLNPKIDNKDSIGMSVRRWASIFVASGTISTSDRNYKQDIQDEALGLSFINKLHPVSYKHKDGHSGRTHHGLIAQEVEEVVNELGILTDDFAPISKNPEYDEAGNETGGFIYGLRYEELIGPLIKATQELYAQVQDLTAKVNKLTPDSSGSIALSQNADLLLYLADSSDPDWWFKNIRILYTNGMYSKEQVANYVTLSKISREQYAAITGEVYEEGTE